MKDAAGKWVGFGLGDVDPKVTLIKQKLHDKYQWVRDWSPALVIDDAYSQTLVGVVKEFQKRVGLPVTGIMNAASQIRLGVATSPPLNPPHRPIWIYTAPGSGADWWFGPSFELGKWCQDVLHLNHQPVGFPKGGYLGMMGGDPTFSYNEVIGFEGAELERLIASCPDLNDPNVEFWFSGYSQSADGMEDALVRLFGDGGRFAHLRSRINGVVQFGNPSKRDTGIARKIRPEWLYALVHNLNHPNDFYAEAPDHIRPPFYAIIVEADTELPFFVHVMKVALPVIAGLPFIGPFLAPVMAVAQPLMGLINGPDEPVDKQLVDLLSAQGVLTHIPDLLQLVGALPGIQAHGDWGPFVAPACDIVASFRR